MDFGADNVSALAQVLIALAALITACRKCSGDGGNDGD